MELQGPDYIIDGVEHRSSLPGKLRGLMLRREGRVLLSFSRSGRHGIWMPLMLMRLDVAFIDGEGRIVDLKKNVPPLSLEPSTWRVYRPEKECTCVLEVEAGLFDEKGVDVGDMLDLPG